MCNPYLRRKAELTRESVCAILVIAELHEAHPGISRMKAIIHGYVFWPNMDREIEDAVKRCRQCQLHQKAPAEGALNMLINMLHFLYGIHD